VTAGDNVSDTCSLVLRKAKPYGRDVAQFTAINMFFIVLNKNAKRIAVLLLSVDILSRDTF
jgi:hypothetical protein